MGEKKVWGVGRFENERWKKMSNKSKAEQGGEYLAGNSSHSTYVHLTTLCKKECLISAACGEHLATCSWSQMA